MAERDRSRRRPGERLAGRIESFQHAGLRERGHHVRRWAIEMEPPLLDQLHRRGRGDRLGHRGDPDHGVGGHRCAAALHPLAEAALVDWAIPIGRERRDARHLAVRDRLAQQRVRLGLQGHELASRFAIA
jgi:hypothetical protein